MYFHEFGYYYYTCSGVISDGDTVHTDNKINNTASSANSSTHQALQSNIVVHVIVLPT